MTTEQKHEIEIPGLPEGWQAVAYRLGKAGEYFFCATYEEVMMLDEDTEFILVLIVEKKNQAAPGSAGSYRALAYKQYWGLCTGTGRVSNRYDRHRRNST